eukprot:1937775-Rhodomonas_salina.2
MAARWQPGDDQEDWATQRRAWGRHIKLWLTARIECWWWEDNVKRFIVGLLMKWLHPPMALDCNVHSDAGKDWGSAHIQIPDPGRVLNMLKRLFPPLILVTCTISYEITDAQRLAKSTRKLEFIATHPFRCAGCPMVWIGSDVASALHRRLCEQKSDLRALAIESGFDHVAVFLVQASASPRGRTRVEIQVGWHTP